MPIARFLFQSFVVLLMGSVLFSSCKDDELLKDPDAKLTFSTDTVIFDTVFSQVGNPPDRPYSVTRQLRVRNPHNQPITTTIRLGRGNNSPYRLNIDGQPTTGLTDYEIRANDSIFVFVQVFVDPGNVNTPFIVKDSLLFETNGNLQDIKLVAWGQDAHYLADSVLGCDITWTNDKPYVIYNSVLVPRNCKLTIEEGVQIHSHVGSWFYVQGTLEVNGTPNNPVVFQGDRLEQNYENIPGQWVGVALLPGSINNTIDHAIIKNGIVGLQADSTPVNGMPNLVVNNTIIANHATIGLLGFLNPIVQATNCEVTNCGQFTFAGFGGDYVFQHCTFATFNTFFSRREPTLAIANSFTDNVNNIKYTFPIDYSFQNCIIYGDQREEFGIANDADGGPIGQNNRLVEYCLIRTEMDSLDANNNIINENPRFTDPFDFDFTIAEGSPAINTGRTLNPTVIDDVLGNIRDAQPDIGAYEFQ